MDKPEKVQKKKILVISPVPTHPPYSGNSKCTLSYSEMLMEAGYDISFLWVADQTCSNEEIRLTENYWKDKLFIFKLNLLHRLRVAYYRRTRFKRTGNFRVDDFYPRGLESVFEKILKNEHFDAVLVNYIFLSKIFNHVKGAKKILFTHDVFTDRYKQTGNPWFSVTASEEAKALDRADIVLSIQENEAEHYKTLTGTDVLTVYSYFSIHDTAFTGKKILLFLGGRNMHNVEAITLFVDTVFSPLVQAHPDLKLIIGGSVCNVLDQSFGDDSIIIHGEVDDLLEFYSLGDVVINPTVSGTGLKIKTFEAMAYGKVIIAHPHNVIGIFKRETAPILEAVNAGDYIKQINYIFSQKDQILDLKHKSVKYIEDMNQIVASRFTQAIEE